MMAVRTHSTEAVFDSARSPDAGQDGVPPAKRLTGIILLVEYDGSRYHGFQLQGSQPTIQGELEAAILRLTGERARVLTASRTDSGVHARGQVVSFRTGSLLEQGKFVAGLNYYLPAAIAVTSAHCVSDAVNVRRHAISREYSYYILNRPVPSPTRQRFCHLVAGELDIGVMNVACRALVGERDFASFASRMGVEIKSTRRRVFSAKVERDGEMVVFNIVANSFLPHQVRNTVGVLIRVGLGKMTVAEFNSIMEASKPGLAGPSAPPCGLFLDRVNYPADFEEGQFENL